MTPVTIRLGIILTLLGVLLTSAPVRAATDNRLVYLTFSGPVQIPGMTLPGGSYSFELAEPGTSDAVMEVLNRDRTHFFGFFFTVPTIRVRATDTLVVTFRESSRGIPPAIRALFYPGELNGREFFYPAQYRRPVVPASAIALVVPTPSPSSGATAPSGSRTPEDAGMRGGVARIEQLGVDPPVLAPARRHPMTRNC
jgi:hypothetical protein